MNIRKSLILSISLATTLPLQIAAAQTDQRCSLKTVTEALNNLGCIVSGAYVSPDSLVAAIKDSCAPTADAETCHACFRKAGGKVGPALKALAKVKVFTRATLSQFKIALVTAEEVTCEAKDAEESSVDDDSDETYSRPTDAGGPESGPQGRDRSRDDSVEGRPERPERPDTPQRPERPERRR